MPLRKLRDEEQGFTLIEILVVILIVGVLAATALPTFLGQQKKGQDAAAKSDARNAVSQIESCFTTTQDYTLCVAAAGQLTQAATGLDLVTGAPSRQQVQITGQTTTGYTVNAKSKSDNVFTIMKSATGRISRTCTPAGGDCAGAGASW